jgi:hypothetical protein
LLSGIDTLDMTCKSPASRGLVADLDRLKVEAQEKRREAVTLEVGGEFLRVLPTGLGGGYPYALEHRNGRLAVGETSNMPAWKVSPSAEALHTVGPLGAVAFFRSLVEALTGGPVELMASRLDTHADVLGLVITEADVADFVCQARKYAAWREGDLVQTHWWGPGGDQSVRAYLKRDEIAASGRGGYLLPLWAEKGDDGQTPITRVESQTRRRVLRQLGVATAEEAIGRAGEVYVYATGKWLRWIDPTTATRAVRAEVDQRWGIVQGAAVAAGASMPKRHSTERHAPQLDRLVPMLNGLMVAAGAALGVEDPDDALRQISMLMHAYREDNGRDYAAEVRTRNLEFGPPSAA